ncbi:MAG TPA: YkvA family protein [Chitinispirillaceae bacterium]|nr:YkvA family protein [Chitinispirillaceae bacterium]
MDISGKLKHKSRELKQQLIVIYYAYHSPKTNFLPRIIILICVAYALSPIDLIPDFIPVLGYLDDLIIIPALLALAIKLIPKDVLEESIKKAASERISLKKNWAFAIIFITIWTILIIAIVKAFIGTFANI